MSDVSVLLSVEEQPEGATEAEEINVTLEDSDDDDDDAEVASDGVHGLGEGRTEVTRETYGRRSDGLWNLPYMMFRKPTKFKRILFSYGADEDYIYELSEADLKSPSIDSQKRAIGKKGKASSRSE